MSTPSEKFDYAAHLGNVLLKDDFAGSPLCTTGDEGVVRGDIRTVIDLAITAARAADAAEIERLRAENDQLRKGAPLGPIIGANTIVEQEIELKKLRAELAELKRDIAAKAEAAAKAINDRFSIGFLDSRVWVEEKITAIITREFGGTKE